MGRQKTTPTKFNSSEGCHSRYLDYIPVKPRRSKKRSNNSLSTGQCYKILIPSEKNKQFHLGKLLAGTTHNELPDTWSTCKMSFLFKRGTPNKHLLINLDSTSVLVELLPGNDVVEEVIYSRIFAIHVLLIDGSVFFDLYFCDLPLPRFTKRLGLCIQTVLSLVLDVPIIDDNEESEVDLSSEFAVAQLYKNIRKEREKSNKIECENVQHPRLKPQLRPYQEDAVRWMLQQERKTDAPEGELHPLYTVIKLESGLDIYYDKYSGYVDITKPTIETTTKGGILADEMGLGKTVEVLACILLHSKPLENEENINLETSPTVKLISKKRKMRETKPEPKPDLIDQSKKLKVPDDWVKSSSKKSQTYVALETWYNSVLQTACKKTEHKDENALQCICGGSSEEGSVTCIDCDKIQHGDCLGYKKNFGPYRCPQCWMNQPLLETKATLIVSPVSLRTQWCKEICKHIKGDLKVLQYGGSSVTPTYPNELTKYDIVITTYSVLQSELRLTETEKALSFRHHKRYSAPGSPLTRVKWWRLCLDEAQTVETTTSMVSAMAKKLTAHFRWAVTGTPISKEISDLHGLIDYLHLEPYNDSYTWEQLLFNPYSQGKTAPMLTFLAQVLWRSSKDDVIDQINIPKQTIKEHWLSFSTIEHHFYKCEHSSSQKVFLDKVRSHEPDVPLQSLDKSALKMVLAPLLSLRQICTYPNSIKTRYLATKKPVKSMKDLLDALIAKNNNESEEYLRVVLSALNGLAGIYLLLQAPEQAIEEYRAVLQLYTRFTEEEKIAKLSVDKLQVVHAMHNLAEVLDTCATNGATLRDDTLRRDCQEVEKKYIEKFINQSMAALQDTLLITANVTKLQDSFVLDAGRWYSDLLEWIYVHSYDQELYTRIENLHSVANVECSVDFKNARSLIYAISSWDDHISNLRENAIQVVNDLYTHCPEDEFQIIVSDELVQKATDCHLRPQKKSKSSKKKCPVCVANDHLKAYEFELFFMGKRTTNFEDMSLKGSWKPTPQELIFRSILAIGRAKNANNDLVKDGEIHINILDTLKKEFKEVRKLWTHLDQQICAQDELDMCKTRLRLKGPNDDKPQKKEVTSILKNLTYNLENKVETIFLLDEHELEHQRIVLHNEEHRNMAFLDKNIATRKYLETLTQQHNENQSLDPCPICKNALENHWGMVPCGHSYCFDCIQQLIDQIRGQHLQCCVCRAYYSVIEISYTKTDEQNQEVETAKIAGNYSTKVESIVKLIMELRSEDCDVKILVFSSWVSVLNYVKEALTNNDIPSELVSSGSLEKQIEKFKDERQHITALLLPINLGAKGLNLVEATHVILTEPLLNVGDELQAIGRVHRIGQTRPTVVHKFFIKGSIEESIQKAVSSDSQNWEKNKVTIGQLMNLFENDNTSTT
ncbi:hypothetical protein Zmor_000523 [Zophobas morio]|uniref:E3 ubiquitin-protein ligase SHPRH n=1 Tax=Zophobas morio TaxID=2755281 RepID=A0AA38J1G4_9CUCU|nr:hypothetical protein Zmor_000523 [Zophobas morio]